MTDKARPQSAAAPSANFSKLGPKDSELEWLKEAEDGGTLSTASSESIVKVHEIYDETNYIPNT